MTTIGRERRVPPRSCLGCGKVMDATSCVGADASPLPGDVTICAYCGTIMAFADDLGLRDLTDAEAVAVAGDGRIIAVQRARATIWKKSD